MEGFIDKFINELVEKHWRNFNRACVVFPTRRACVIFKNRLADKIKHASWLPSVYSISDFISLVSPYKILQRPQLLLKLFPVYKQFYTNATYSNFIGWGEMMLKDFDEMDRYLVDKDVLFSGMEKIKEIEAGFQFTEEDRSAYSEFWKSFSNRELSASKETFLKTWKVLPEIYSLLQQELTSVGCNYEGYVYRLLATNPESFLDMLKYDHFHFAGFYALSASEEKIIEYLLQSGKAFVYWDADSYYLNNPKLEAGRFIRESGLAADDIKWVGNYFENGNKTIEIVGVNGKTLMARHSGKILENLLKTSHDSESDIALVLPEESMLMPVLNSLPGNIQNLNVTMGYSIRDHFFYPMFKTVKKLNETKKVRGERLLVYTEAVRELLTNVLLTQYGFTPISKILMEVKKIRSAYIDVKVISDSLNEIHEDATRKFLLTICSIPNNASAIVKYISEILKWFTSREAETKEGVFGNKNLMQHLQIAFSEFALEIKGDIEKFDESSCWQLLNDFFIKFKFPFSGEPVLGVQLMGFLETRVLDFKTLIITNVNECILPSDSSKSSFIPFGIRKAFKLPTFLNQDAIFAYHFFRLIQRAENIFLLYNTEVGSASGGEISRYILQIVYELQKKFENRISIKHKLVSEQITVYSDNDILIKRDANLTEQLIKLFAIQTNNESIKRFTPSSINSFIYCPFKFYLHYVRGLREDETVEESMQANEFGNVFHKTLEQLYSPFLNLEINNTDIENLLSEVMVAVENALKTEYDKYYVNDGENYLFQKVLEELVVKTLKHDMLYAPFRIIALEAEYSQYIDLGDNISVKLFGKFDRIDQKEETTRVIDYKTGKADLATEILPQDLFTNSDHKINLQLLIYNELASANLHSLKVLCGVYPLKKSSDGMQYLAGMNALNEQTRNAFFNQLKDFLKHILFESEFKQTSDYKKCEKCGFKRLCNR